MISNKKINLIALGLIIINIYFYKFNEQPIKIILNENQRNSWYYFMIGSINR